jgi:hypothetical protein
MHLKWASITEVRGARIIKDPTQNIPFWGKRETFGPLDRTTERRAGYRTTGYHVIILWKINVKIALVFFIFEACKSQNVTFLKTRLIHSSCILLFIHYCQYYRCRISLALVLNPEDHRLNRVVGCILWIICVMNFQPILLLRLFSTKRIIQNYLNYLLYLQYINIGTVEEKTRKSKSF